jgi:hypothetical protein
MLSQHVVHQNSLVLWKPSAQHERRPCTNYIKKEKLLDGKTVQRENFNKKNNKRKRLKLTPAQENGKVFGSRRHLASRLLLNFLENFAAR